MKKIFFMAFAIIFGLIALALPRAAKAALTCGTAGTEGMPTCNSVSNPGEKCCVPAYHKGIKTVVKTGTKTQAHAHAVHVNSAVATESHTAVAATAQQTAPAINAPTPSPVIPSASAVVGKTESAQSAPAAMAPSAPVAPSAPAAAASASGSAKAASSK